MFEKYLIDTSIWIDLYEDRKGFHNEPLGDYALKLLATIKSQEMIIVLTDLLLRELEMNYSLSEINGMFKPFEKITEKIIATKEEREEAKRIAQERNLPPGDALHAIIARDKKLVLITRDKHFKQLEDISKHYMPEDIT
ncbi:MAG: type II toxin-antitoxin system VapC family toxin [archaeon]